MDKKRCYGCMKEITQPVCEHCGWSEFDQNAPHQLPVGTVLNEKYVVGRVLGQGGFGITYLGWDKYLEQRVAIKEYYPSGSVMRESEISTVVASYGGALAARYQRNKERFLKEAQILARFNEEKEIVHVSNMFEANNTAYFVMEFVDGITLKQHVKNSGGKLSNKETFALLRPVMNALEKLHKAGLVHRDISPDNIMLLQNGGVKLIDFGAVRNVDHADQETPLTKSTEAILKQGYAPIEQYQNRGSLGPWTDVYALCATIYYCLTGEVPPDAPERLLTEAPLEIQKHIPNLSAHQAAVLERGMAMHPRDRIPSMDELQKQLFNPIAKIVPPPPPKKEGEPASQPKKQKWLIPSAAVLAVLAIVLAVVFTRPRTEEPAPTVAPTELPVTEAPTIPLTGIPAEDNILMPAILGYDYDQWKPLPMERVWEASDSAVFSNDRIRRGAVVSLTFHDTLAGAPEDAWDVSQKQNGCVLAWAEQEGSYYHLHIGAEGGVYAPENSSTLFAYHKNLERIDFGGAFHTENVTNMSRMFYHLEAIEELDVSSFDTSNVTNMAYAFAIEERAYNDFRSSLEVLDVSSLNTSKVTDMRGVFDGLCSLTKLDLSNWDTSNVTDMSAMFRDCSALNELDVSGFNTSCVTDMSYMFRDCSSLSELDISSFDTGLVQSMAGMFGWCHNLAVLDVSNFDTRNVKSMCGMFQYCNSIPSLDLRNFDTSNVTNMASMFYLSEDSYMDSSGYCSALTHLDLSSFDTSSVTDMNRMFYGCDALTSLDLSNFNTSNVTNMSYMFHNCRRLKYLNLSSFETHNVLDMSSMFYWTPYGLILMIDEEKFDTSNVKKYDGFANWDYSNLFDAKTQ